MSANCDGPRFFRILRPSSQLTLHQGLALGSSLGTVSVRFRADGGNERNVRAKGALDVQRCLMCSTAEASTATVLSPLTCVLSAGLLRRLVLEAQAWCAQSVHVSTPPVTTVCGRSTVAVSCAGTPRGRPCQPSAAALQPATEVAQTRRHALVGGAAALAAGLLVPGCVPVATARARGRRNASPLHRAGLLRA